MEAQGAQLAANHARILLFSYGSGSTSTLLELQAWTDLHRPGAAGASHPVCPGLTTCTSPAHQTCRHSPHLGLPGEEAGELSLGPTKDPVSGLYL